MRLAKQDRQALLKLAYQAQLYRLAGDSAQAVFCETAKEAVPALLEELEAAERKIVELEAEVARAASEKYLARVNHDKA